jgi:hypothetical protein
VTHADCVVINRGTGDQDLVETREGRTCRFAIHTNHPS